MATTVKKPKNVLLKTVTSNNITIAPGAFTQMTFQESPYIDGYVIVGNYLAEDNDASILRNLQIVATPQIIYIRNVAGVTVTGNIKITFVYVPFDMYGTP